MSTTGQTEEQISPSLTERPPVPIGAAPELVEHVVCRITLRPDGGASTRYIVADEPPALSPAEWSAWLNRRGLNEVDPATIDMLVIREAVDDAGDIRECMLERRRGSANGPLHGDPARVDFLGPASMPRFYQISRDGGLAEVPANTEALLPHRPPHLFNGEQPAVQRHFGVPVRVVDAREPTLLEQLVGLDSILRVRLPNGREVACGVGWHGPVPFVLQAEFPRFIAPLLLDPDDAASIERLLASDDLVRHETRLDAQGIAVIARRRGTHELFLLRSIGGEATLEAYQPSPEQAASPDQARWLRFAETYEHLAVLDAWADADDDDLVVVTGETNGQIWRHHIDGDGVETWRRPDDEAATGVLYRERLAPGVLVQTDTVAGEVVVAQRSPLPSVPALVAGAAPFGEAVELAFPQAGYDVEEAALCLSCHRSSAAVYHCMRIIECGLAILHIDAAAEGRDWNRVIARLRRVSGAERDGLLPALGSVRRYWRGAQLMPAEKYTEAEAERLFGAVGAFMRILAEVQLRNAAEG